MGRRAWYYVTLVIGYGGAAIFGLAIWRHWMDDDLAVFLSSLVLAVTLTLRWTVFRRLTVTGRPDTDPESTRNLRVR
jgi:hypothetical protein